MSAWFTKSGCSSNSFGYCARGYSPIVSRPYIFDAMAATDPLAALNAPQRRAVTYGQPLADGKGVQCGPVAGGGRCGHRQDRDHRASRRLAGDERRRSGAHPAADLHAPRRGRRCAGARTTSCARRSATRSATRPRRCCSGWSGPAPFTRSATGCCATTGATSTSSPAITVIDRSDSADLFDNLRQELKLERAVPALSAQGHLPRDLFLAHQHAEEPARDARAAVPAGASAGSRTWPSCAAPTSSASSAAACSTTTTCWSTGRR